MAAWRGWCGAVATRAKGGDGLLAHRAPAGRPGRIRLRPGRPRGRPPSGADGADGTPCKSGFTVACRARRGRSSSAVASRSRLGRTSGPASARPRTAPAIPPPARPPMPPSPHGPEPDRRSKAALLSPGQRIGSRGPELLPPRSAVPLQPPRRLSMGGRLARPPRNARPAAVPLRSSSGPASATNGAHGPRSRPELPRRQQPQGFQPHAGPFLLRAPTCRGSGSRGDGSG